MGPFGWRTTFFIVSAGLAAALVQPVAAKVDVKDYEVKKKFKGNRATDLSGIACIPIDQGKSYRCPASNLGIFEKSIRMRFRMIASLNVTPRTLLQL